MAENKLEIIISAVDEASEKIKAITENIDKNISLVKERMNSISRATVSFGNEMRTLGKTVSSAGLTMSFFGAGITAPFILALKNSAQNSTALAMKIDNLKATFQEFQMKMAAAVIPIVDRFSNVVANLNSFLNSLSPAMINTVMQTTMMVGIFLIFGGVLTSIVGKIVTLTGALVKLFGIFMGFAAANLPLIAIAGSIALITFLMFKFQAVSDVVMSTFQVLFLTLKNSFDGIVIAVESAILGVLTAIQWIVDKMALIPGPTKAMFESLSSGIQGVTDTLRGSIQLQIADIQTNVNTISGIFQTGVGTWSQSFDKFKIKVGEVKDSILGLGATTATTTKTSNELWKKQEMGVQSALSTMSAALTQAAAENKKFALAAKVVAIGLAIVNTAVGITNALAVPPPWFGMALAAIIGAAGAIQIATIAATPLAEGGIVTRPTHALVGEAGPEAVIPLSKYGMGNQTSIEVNIYGAVSLRSDEDIKTLAEEISAYLAKETERL